MWILINDSKGLLAMCWIMANDNCLESLNYYPISEVFNASINFDMEVEVSFEFDDFLIYWNFYKKKWSKIYKIEQKIFLKKLKLNVKLFQN